MISPFAARAPRQMPRGACLFYFGFLRRLPEEDAPGRTKAARSFEERADFPVSVQALRTHLHFPQELQSPVQAPPPPL